MHLFGKERTKECWSKNTENNELHNILPAGLPNAPDAGADTLTAGPELESSSPSSPTPIDMAKAFASNASSSSPISDISQPIYTMVCCAYFVSQSVIQSFLNSPSSLSSGIVISFGPAVCCARFASSSWRWRCSSIETRKAKANSGSAEVTEPFLRF